MVIEAEPSLREIVRDVDYRDRRHRGDALLTVMSRPAGILGRRARTTVRRRPRGGVQLGEGSDADRLEIGGIGSGSGSDVDVGSVREAIRRDGG